MINAQVQKEIEEQNNVADLHQFMQENKQLMQYGIKKGALPKSIFDRPSLIRANLNANNSDLYAFVARLKRKMDKEMLKPLSQQSSTLMSNISIPELSTVDEQFQQWVGNCTELSNTQKCLIRCGVLLGMMRPEQARNCKLLYNS